MNMVVVIFRAKVREFDAQYTQLAAELRRLALDQFGCVEFHAVTEGHEEIALSYWPDLQSVRAWKAHSTHLLAQKLGQERWYERYSVQIAQIEREYRSP